MKITAARIIRQNNCQAAVLLSQLVRLLAQELFRLQLMSLFAWPHCWSSMTAVLEVAASARDAHCANALGPKSTRPAATLHMSDAPDRGVGPIIIARNPSKQSLVVERHQNFDRLSGCSMHK